MNKLFAIVIVSIGSLILIGFLFWIAPTTIGAQLPIIITLVIGIGGMIVKQVDTDEKVDAKIAVVDIKLEEQKHVSQGNSQAIAAVTQQTTQVLEQMSQELADNTAVTLRTKQGVDTTYTMIDGQRTALLAELASVKKDVAKLLQEKAVAKVEVKHDENLDRIATAIEAVAPIKSENE